jgi:hypothetical protein
MITFTFDTNCIIDMDERRASAAQLDALVAAHRSRCIDVAFVAVSASERQPGDTYLPTYSEFETRLTKLGLDDIPQILGTAYFDISYFDRALYVDDTSIERERQIHRILFPNVEFEWVEFCSATGIDPSNADSPAGKRWRNAWCDRQMLWAHDVHQRDVFVTRDRNFRKLLGKVGFDRLQVCTPDEASAMIP